MVTGFEELKARNEMLNTLLAFESMEKESNLPTFKPSMFEAKFGDEECETLKIGDGKKMVLKFPVRLTGLTFQKLMEKRLA